jgi:hypothetical protein
MARLERIRAALVLQMGEGVDGFGVGSGAKQLGDLRGAFLVGLARIGKILGQSSSMMETCNES